VSTNPLLVDAGHAFWAIGIERHVCWNLCFSAMIAQFPLEIQLVHQMGSSSFLIISVLFETGAEAPTRLFDGLQCVSR
jgi:hypothetical protein